MGLRWIDGTERVVVYAMRRCQECGIPISVSMVVCRDSAGSFPNMLQTPLEDMLGKDSLYMDITSTTVADFMEHDPECAACEWKSACCGGWKDRKDALLREIGVLG